MKTINDEELLSKVKTALGITGEYQDATLQIYITEIQEFLAEAGVHEKVIHSNLAIGVICRGVSDLWNYGAGNAELSTYFMQRAAQLVLKEVEEDESNK